MPQESQLLLKDDTISSTFLKVSCKHSVSLAFFFPFHFFEKLKKKRNEEKMK